MADIRSLFRSEVASRQNTGKKRKASLEAGIDVLNTKKPRPGNLDSVRNEVKNLHVAKRANLDVSPPQLETVVEEEIAQTSQPDTRQILADVDEQEWRAFERDVAEAVANEKPGTAGKNSVSIEAQPLSAIELAAQVGASDAARRGRRETEAEEEHDDAATRIIDEFETLTALEDRVKTLRARREALRQESGIEAVRNSALTDEVRPSESEDIGSSEDEHDDAWLKTRRTR